jgi:hypothetical protein
METKGFYKYEDGNLHFANSVISLDYILVEEKKDTLQFPVDGWWWFDNEEEANGFFNVPKKIIE